MSTEAKPTVISIPQSRPRHNRLINNNIVFTTHPPNAPQRNSQRCADLCHPIASPSIPKRYWHLHQACTTIFQFVDSYDHSRTSAWNTNIIVGLTPHPYLRQGLQLSPISTFTSVTSDNPPRTPSSKPSSPRPPPPTAPPPTNSRSPALSSSTRHRWDRIRWTASMKGGRREQTPWLVGGGCIRRRGRFGIMRGMGCGALSMREGRARGSMLWLVWCGLALCDALGGDEKGSARGGRWRCLL